jgi:hypothetical protein
MVRVSCPACHVNAARVSLQNGYKYYCVQCGWNVGVAQAALQSTIRTSIWVLSVAAVIIVVVLFKNLNNWGIAGGVAVAFGGLPAFWISRARYDLRRLRNAHNATGLEKGSFAPHPEQQSWSALESLPRPRRLTLDWRGRAYALIAIAGGPFGLYLVALAIRDDVRRGRSAVSELWPFAIVAGVICFLMLTFVRDRLRERRLLAEGAIATGYVVDQQTGRHTQSIAYRFQDAAGRSFTGRCTDPSRSLYEGMTTPVFYDANQPTQSIPLNCSLTKIVAQQT